MSQAVNALITATEYRTFINIEDGDGAPDALIESHVGSSSTLIARYCHRTFIKPSAAVDWVFDGNRTNSQYIPDRPIIATPAPTLKYWDGTTWQTVTNIWTYDAAAGLLYFTDGGWFVKGLRNYKLTYLAGYVVADIPQDLKFACAQLVFRMIRKIVDRQEGIASDSFDGHTATYDFNKIPPDLKQILDSYKVVSFG